MEPILTRFIEQLREAGIPVSMVEAIDAARGLEHTDLASPESLRSLLGCTLIKSDRHRGAFDATFDAYFSLREPPAGSEEANERTSTAEGLIAAAVSGRGVGGDGEGEHLDLITALTAAIENDDEALLQAVVRIAVDRLAAMEPGRPVGGAYYLYRVMRQMQLDEIEQSLVNRVEADSGSMTHRLELEEIERRLADFRSRVEAEIRRRLVEDRGPEAVARTVRRPLLEDVDLTSATATELAAIERLMHPLGRRLATRLSQRRRSGDRGRLDVRTTMRASLSTGGAPADPHFRRRRRGMPEIVMLCDVSGSVATFARFTMQLVYSIARQFSRVRTFAFIDGIDEVTGLLSAGTDFRVAMERIGSEAEVVWLDGHSDYGHAFRSFTDQYLDTVITPRSTVIVTGDARSNYHDPDAAALEAISRRARALYWLNPEPERYWDTGDSVMGRYLPWCDEATEVRNLRQLEAFVERVATPHRASRNLTPVAQVGAEPGRYS